MRDAVKNMNAKTEECVKISLELLEKVDELVKQLNFGSREAFVEAAVRRLIDQYAILKVDVIKS